MRTLDELAAAYTALPLPPRGIGRVELVVLREPDERRRTPEVAMLTPEGGVVGDKWAAGTPRDTDDQVTLMRADVARLCAGDDDLARFGDNLFVALDLSEAHLPAGTRLAIGGALLEVTAKPHTGCSKFRRRGGDAALRLTLDPRWVHERLRGIHARVIVGGEVRRGDVIEVRPT